jgi:prepilin-type processing-associated H-X9-DG protein
VPATGLITLVTAVPPGLRALGSSPFQGLHPWLPTAAPPGLKSMNVATRNHSLVGIISMKWQRSRTMKRVVPRSGPWAQWGGCDLQPQGSTPDGVTRPGHCAINCTNQQVYSFHPGGANVVFADGSVHFLNAGIDIRVFARLVTRAGGRLCRRMITEIRRRHHRRVGPSARPGPGWRSFPLPSGGRGYWDFVKHVHRIRLL